LTTLTSRLPPLVYLPYERLPVPRTPHIAGANISEKAPHPPPTQSVQKTIWRVWCKCFSPPFLKRQSHDPLHIPCPSPFIPSNLRNEFYLFRTLLFSVATVLDIPPLRTSPREWGCIGRVTKTRVPCYSLPPTRAAIFSPQY